MKKSSLFFIAALCSLFSFSQDIIIKKTGEEIKAKVAELTDDAIKYRKFENIDGPLYNVARKEVFQIRYANGTVEMITPVTEPAESKPQTSTVKALPVTSQYDSLMKRSKASRDGAILGFIMCPIFAVTSGCFIGLGAISESGALKGVMIGGGALIGAGAIALGVLAPISLHKSKQQKKAAEALKPTAYYPVKLQFYPTAIGTAPGIGMKLSF